MAAIDRNAVLRIRRISLGTHRLVGVLLLVTALAYPAELAVLIRRSLHGDTRSWPMTAGLLAIMIVAGPLVMHTLHRRRAWTNLLQHLRRLGVDRPTCIEALAGRGDGARLGLRVLAAADQTGLVLVTDARDAHRAQQYRRIGFQSLPEDPLALYRLPNDDNTPTRRIPCQTPVSA